MGKLSNLLERSAPRVSLDEVARVIRPTMLSPLEENFKVADDAWKRDCRKLEDLKDRFVVEKLHLSSGQFSKMQQDIAFLESVTETSHRLMGEALSALESFQFEESKKWELDQNKRQLAVLGAQIAECDSELLEIMALERSLPQKRLHISGKRQDLWRQFAEIQTVIRGAENAHS